MPMMDSVTEYSSKVLKKFSKRDAWLKNKPLRTHCEIVKNNANKDLRNSNSKKTDSKEKLETSVAQGKGNNNNNDKDNLKEVSELVDKGLYGKGTTVFKSKVTVVASKKTEVDQRIFDKETFDAWKKTAEEKQISRKAIKQRERVVCNNYYRVFEETEDKVLEEEFPIEERKDKNEKMPEVEPDAFKIPTFTTVVTNTNRDKEENTKEKTAWETILSKEKKREFQAVHKTTSQRYLPKNIMQQTELEATVQKETKYVIPISIRMKPKRYSRATIKAARVVIAVLNAMQKVFPETKLGQIDDNKATPITQAIQIPTNDMALKKYLAISTDEKPGLFFGKIYILSNHTLQEYKKNSDSPII